MNGLVYLSASIDSEFMAVTYVNMLYDMIYCSADRTLALLKSGMTFAPFFKTWTSGIKQIGFTIRD